ncbi:hypothetical protein TRICI_005487 [Trichomonascus ciferrii]|uniref:Uncharacterized protein n=1 Tax=Trichomonascus ciferrii TaxID=44093 RepID=A0A642UUB0_9ASCO|nr:hypothetical protein TRICI_005487 [Trichomonascus ciferrii]
MHDWCGIMLPSELDELTSGDLEIFQEEMAEVYTALVTGIQQDQELMSGEEEFIRAGPKGKDRQVRKVVVEEFTMFLSLIPETTESITPSVVWIRDFLKYLAMTKASSIQRPIAENTIKKYHTAAVDYCKWKYGDQGFEYTKENRSMVNEALAEMATEGRYLYNCKMDVVKYYFPDHVSYILDKVYRHASLQSTEMRKVWFHRILTLLLYTATAARDTDIAVAPAFIGKTPHHGNGERAYCLSWADVHIYVDTTYQSPTIADCQCMVELKYCEGKKELPNDNVKKYFGPILDYPNLCPISTLLVHAIENGLVEGSSVAEAIRRAKGDPKHEVQWKYPKRPVLCAEGTDGSLLLDIPATLFHVNKVLYAMTDLANVPHFAVCNLRRGCQGANTDEELQQLYADIEAVRYNLQLLQCPIVSGDDGNLQSLQVDFHRLALDTNEHGLTPPFYVTWESAMGSPLFQQPIIPPRGKRQLSPRSALTQFSDSSLNSPPRKSRKTHIKPTNQNYACH